MRRQFFRQRKVFSLVLLCVIAAIFCYFFLTSQDIHHHHHQLLESQELHVPDGKKEAVTNAMAEYQALPAEEAVVEIPIVRQQSPHKENLWFERVGGIESPYAIEQSDAKPVPKVHPLPAYAKKLLAPQDPRDPICKTDGRFTALSLLYFS